jgi:hypothetical protein
MAKSKLSDLNDHLFEEIEWLMDRDVKGEALKEEIMRSEAVTRAALTVVAADRLALDAMKAAAQFPQMKKNPALLE